MAQDAVDIMNHERSILVEGGELRAVYLPGDGDTLIISFGCLFYSPSNSTQFWGDELFRSLHVPAIGIVTTHDNWYPQQEFAHIVDEVRRVASGYKNVVAYGFSMGAYGALRYSRALGVTHVLALSPQWSIDPESVPWDWRYTTYFRRYNRGMEIARDHVAGRIYIVNDDKDVIDQRHYEMISKLGPMEQGILRYAQHDTASVLASTNVMSEIFARVVENDRSGLQRVLRARRSNERYKSLISLGLAQRSWEKGDVRMARTLVHYAIDIWDRNAAAYYLLSIMHEAQNARTEAIAAARRACEIDPASWRRLYLANVLNRAGGAHKPEAVSIVQELNILEPDNADIRKLLDACITGC